MGYKEARPIVAGAPGHLSIAEQLRCVRLIAAVAEVRDVIGRQVLPRNRP